MPGVSGSSRPAGADDVAGSVGMSSSPSLIISMRGGCIYSGAKVFAAEA